MTTARGFPRGFRLRTAAGNGILPSRTGGYRQFLRTGFSRKELFTRFYKNADIFVMLGMADYFGLALLEASAFGLPIVAMRLDSGLSDLLALTGNAIQLEPVHQIFDSSGVHCLEAAELARRIQADHQTELVDQIAGAIGELLADHERRREMGVRGRKAISSGILSNGCDAALHARTVWERDELMDQLRNLLTWNMSARDPVFLCLILSFMALLTVLLVERPRLYGPWCCSRRRCRSCSQSRATQTAHR